MTGATFEPPPRVHRRGGRPVSYRASQHDMVDASWPPSQHATEPRCQPPERRLLTAILTEALHDACGRATIQGTEGGGDSARVRDTLRQEALAWMYGSHAQPWGFLWICEHLGLSPDTILTDYHLMPKKTSGNRRNR